MPPEGLLSISLGILYLQVSSVTQDKDIPPHKPVFIIENMRSPDQFDTDHLQHRMKRLVDIFQLQLAGAH